MNAATFAPLGTPAHLIQEVFGMGRVHDTFAATLAADLAARTEWDQPPALYWVCLTAGEVTLRPFPFDEIFLEVESPAEALSAAAQAMSQNQCELQRVVPVGLHGLAFFVEAWAVYYPDDASDEQIDTDRREGMANHPERIERRGLQAVDRAGIRYLAEQIRDGEPTTTICYPNRASDLTGTIYEALDQMLTAVLGVELPR